MTKNEKIEFKKFRAGEELKIILYKTLTEFKSKEEPDLEFNELDKLKVLLQVSEKYLNRGKNI